LFLNAPGFRFPPSGFSFQLFSFSAFCFVLGFSIPYSTRISCGIRARLGKFVAKVKHAIPAQERPEAAQPMV
jgi:hypothetical protein